jgi:hypothetical protein
MVVLRRSAGNGLFARKSLATVTAGALLLLALAAGQPRAAASVYFDPMGTGSFGPTTLLNLDWAPGSTLAQNGVTAVNNFAAGSGSTTFFDYYQAKLGTFGLTDGSIATMPGGTQLSVVMGMTEQVTALTGTPGGTGASATFHWDSGPKNWLEIYYNPTGGPTLSDTVAGSNFNQGKLILRAQITGVNDTVFTVTAGGGTGSALDQDASGDWYRNKNTGTTEITTVMGNGSTTVTAQIDTTPTDYYGWDPNFFKFTDGNSYLNLTFIQNAGLDTPFLSTPPSSGFVDTANSGAMDSAGPLPNLDIGPGTAFGTGMNPATDGPNTVGAVNGLSGPDIVFQTDTNETFAQVDAAVPAPLAGPVGLLGLGVVVMGTFGHRARARRWA